MPVQTLDRDETHGGGEFHDDPAFRRCRREAFLILGLWLCCFLWTTTYCYLNGYLTHEPLPAKKSFGPDIAKIVGPLESFNRRPNELAGLSASTAALLGSPMGQGPLLTTANLHPINTNADRLNYPFGLGIPDWVFWGIVVPWVICIVLSLTFCFFVFAEDDLGADSEES